MQAAGAKPAGAVRLDDYDVIVFDCDGVLLDSNDLKSRAFAEVLAAHGFPADEVDAFRTFQRSNFGLSRYRLFEAAVEGRFGARRDASLEVLLESFGRACREGYLAQPETPGLEAALLRASRDGRRLYVVSGSDEAELREVFEARGLSRHFAAIYGSPASKTENMRRVAEHCGGIPGRRLFVGDADADMRAALEAGADFVFMAAYSTVRPSLEPRARAAGCIVIEDLRDL